MKKLGLYIHIPFCIKKCNYCDFVSYEAVDELTIKDYVKSLILEISSKKDEASDYIVDSIFIGGGTPSIILESHIYDILNAIYKNYTVDETMEITIESNPKTLTKEKLINYLDFNINRLSIGLQSFNNRDLKILGRRHNVDDFYESYNLARALGFKNINIDLMFAIPHQSIKDSMDNIKKAIELKPEHISYYSLKYEEKTPFYDMLQKGELVETDEEADRIMFWDGVNKLKENGYSHYEISNVSLEKYSCKHNLKYWSMSDYIGFGISASSFFRRKRYVNEKNLQNYINNMKNNQSVVMDELDNSQNDDISEYIFTGLRKIEGISLSQFKNYTQVNLLELFKDEVEEMVEKELLELNEDTLKLTPKGIDISNKVMSEFIL